MPDNTNLDVQNEKKSQKNHQSLELDLHSNLNAFNALPANFKKFDNFDQFLTL